jgi:hypothetical protein
MPEAAQIDVRYDVGDRGYSGPTPDIAKTAPMTHCGQSPIRNFALQEALGFLTPLAAFSVLGWFMHQRHCGPTEARERT